MRQGYIGEGGCAEMRNVQDLLGVEYRGESVGGYGADGSGGRGKTEPTGGLPFGVELDAVVGLVTLLLEAQIAGLDCCARGRV